MVFEEAMIQAREKLRNDVDPRLDHQTYMLLYSCEWTVATTLTVKNALYT